MANAGPTMVEPEHLPPQALGQVLELEARGARLDEARSRMVTISWSRMPRRELAQPDESDQEDDQADGAAEVELELPVIVAASACCWRPR